MFNVNTHWNWKVQNKIELKLEKVNIECKNYGLVLNYAHKMISQPSTIQKVKNLISIATPKILLDSFYFVSPFPHQCVSSFQIFQVVGNQSVKTGEDCIAWYNCLVNIVDSCGSGCWSIWQRTGKSGQWQCSGNAQWHWPQPAGKRSTLPLDQLADRWNGETDNYINTLQWNYASKNLIKSSCQI